MEIKKSLFTDLNAIAAVYQSAFPDAISTILGKKFIVKALSWYIKSDNGLILHSCNKSGISGFACITINKEKESGSATLMFNESYGEALLGLIRKPKLILHPFFIRKLKFAIRKLLLALNLIKPRPSTKPDEFIPNVGIVIIGVNNSLKGSGIGSAILEEIKGFALLNNLFLIRLTVLPENTAAINFYIKNGWQIREQTKNQIMMEKYLTTGKSDKKKFF